MLPSIRRSWKTKTPTILICRCPAGAFLVANPRARGAAGGCSSWDITQTPCRHRKGGAPRRCDALRQHGHRTGAGSAHLENAHTVSHFPTAPAAG